MTTNHKSHTDPARELADLCAELSVATDLTGDEHLAERFGVTSWSTEFFQIIGCILERIDFLISVVKSLDEDDDIQEEAAIHLSNIRSAFSKSALTNPWNYRGSGITAVSPENSQPIKMLSSSVRRVVRYPKLSRDDIQDILSDVEDYEGWLRDQQLVEHDFIRQAILDGLNQFKFRLTKFGWFGYGYTFDSLRSVIAAYKMLEGSVAETGQDVNAEAVLSKGMAFFNKIFTTTGVAKDTVDRADFLLRAYGLITLIHQGTPLAGLLTHMTS